MPQISPPERINLIQLIYRCTTNQFVIPVYQRNYTWDAKIQVKKFLSDLTDILDGNKRSHFIGIMMYYAVNVEFGTDELQVVDGQQRLVTTFLILHCLKEVAHEARDEDTAQTIFHKYLMCHDFEVNNRTRLRLKPLVADDDVYKKLLDGESRNLTREEKRSKVYLNYKFIKEQISALSRRYQISEIVNALDKMYLVVIPLNSDDDAQQIFETINFAGEKLKVTDLIRNFILMNLRSDIQESYYNAYWKPLENLFDKSDKFVMYIRYFLSSQFFTLIDRDEIYENFQTWWHNNNNSEEDIEKNLKLLLDYGKYFASIYISDCVDLPENVEQALVEFRKNPAEPVAPILLVAMQLFKVDKIDSDQLVKVINLVNIYLVRRSLRGLQTGAFTRDVPLILKDILNACDGIYTRFYDQTVKYLVANTRQKKIYMPDDTDLKSWLETTNAYSIGKYLKIAFEKIESDNNRATISFDNLSIEHLMPQTPTDYWRDVTNNMDTEAYTSLVNKIGNLTFAVSNDNSRMSNKNWEDKKEILRQTQHIKMNNELLQKDYWDEHEINKRTQELIDKIIELYAYPEFDDEIVEEHRIFLKSNNNFAKAIIDINGKVTIEMDSIFNVSENLSTRNIENLINEGFATLNSGILKLTADVTFSSLEEVENTLFNGDENPWEKWVNASDEPLSISLRERIRN